MPVTPPGGIWAAGTRTRKDSPNTVISANEPARSVSASIPLMRSILGEDGWEILEGVSPFTLDVALALLAQMCDPRTRDRTKWPMSYPAAVSASRILRYKGITRRSGNGGDLLHRIDEEIRRLQTLRFDLIGFPAWDSAISRWNPAGVSVERRSPDRSRGIRIRVGPRPRLAGPPGSVDRMVAELAGQGLDRAAAQGPDRIRSSEEPRHRGAGQEDRDRRPDAVVRDPVAGSHRTAGRKPARGHRRTAGSRAPQRPLGRPPARPLRRSPAVPQGTGADRQRRLARPLRPGQLRPQQGMGRTVAGQQDHAGPAGRPVRPGRRGTRTQDRQPAPPGRTGPSRPVPATFAIPGCELGLSQASLAQALGVSRLLSVADGNRQDAPQRPGDG